MTFTHVIGHVDGHEIKLETGQMARQANGSVVLRCKQLVLLASATMASEPREGADFFPLTVEFQEKMYAAGKIPGGFLKREGRPSTQATLTSRLIDRPIRPCFPDGFHTDVQVVVSVLSYDQDLCPDAFAILAASAAIRISDMPFNQSVSAARVGLVDGQFVVNGTESAMAGTTLDIIVAGTSDAILMVEAGASEVSESDIMEAIRLAHQSIKQTTRLQDQLVELAGKPSIEFQAQPMDADLVSAISAHMGNQIEQNLNQADKSTVSRFLEQLQADVYTTFITEDGDNSAAVKRVFNTLKKDQIRRAIIVNKVRPDGRAFDEIRDITSNVGLLPSAHGSALFTRGETQSLGVVTLGTAADEQIQDGLQHDMPKASYMLHYNFPPFSVGEVGFVGRLSRREQGHGALAQRALEPILPSKEEFPYTIRVVSEILESNGSSSMASVCSGALSMMDAGVPIKAPVSGIAMGLLLSEDGYAILSDIQGLEDHYGDMDFKVAGTSNGITALQLDIKVGGLSEEILQRALEQANRGRLHILSEMLTVLSASRESISEQAPKIDFIKINPEKIGVVIGPGGKMIRKIEEDSGATVVVLEGNTGDVSISGLNTQSVETAKQIIFGLTKDVEKGDVYNGKISKIMNFGAFVEILPGKDGLVHVSKLTKSRDERIEDSWSPGDFIKVEVVEIDRQNRINLAPISES